MKLRDYEESLGRSIMGQEALVEGESRMKNAGQGKDFFFFF